MTADEHDGDVVCSACREDMEELWREMGPSRRVRQLEVLADYMEHMDLHMESAIIRHLSIELDTYGVVVRAIGAAKDTGDLSREQIKKEIERLKA
jgi:hypothetical protein